MTILFELKHPSDVHLYRHTINYFKKCGRSVDVIVSNREEIVSKLLDQFNIQYQIIGDFEKSMIDKMSGIPRRSIQLRKYVKENDVKIVTGQASIPLAIASIHTKADYIAFTDSEPTPWNFIPAIPTSSVIFTPEMFKVDLGWKHYKINSYKELAYLHPDSFHPREEVYEYVNLTPDDKYILFRFNAFDATHDIAKGGISLTDKYRIINNLKKDYHILISSELTLPEDLKRYKVTIPEFLMHDLIFHSEMLIADTQTSVVEAGCMGVPAIRCNSFVGPNDMGNVVEMEKRFKLIINLNNPEEIIPQVRNLLANPDTKEIWRKRLSYMLSEKINLSKFFIWFYDNYPDSLLEIRMKNIVSFQFN